VTNPVVACQTKSAKVAIAGDVVGQTELAGPLGKVAAPAFGSFGGRGFTHEELGGVGGQRYFEEDRHFEGFFIYTVVGLGGVSGFLSFFNLSSEVGRLPYVELDIRFVMLKVKRYRLLYSGYLQCDAAYSETTEVDVTNEAYEGTLKLERPDGKREPLWTLPVWVWFTGMSG
jgi:hypothetical protein